MTPEQARRDRARAGAVGALLDVYSNFGGVLSPDGTRVLFHSDRGGVPELFLAEVAHPEREAIRLVAGPERVGSAFFLPDGKTILFRRDSGADENFHIFQIGVDGSGLTDLTPGPALWRDTPLVPRDRPDRMIFSARTHTDYASKILVQPLSPGGAKVVYRDPGPGTAVDVSRDGTRALWIREVSTGGHELLEVDLESGRARMVSPQGGRRDSVSAAAYSADGSRILVATDGGGERQALWALDRTTLALAAEYRQEAPFSPLRKADRIVAPLFIYQGQNDGRVPRAQADAIVRALRRRRVPVEYMVAADEGHTVARRANQVEFLTRVLRFLDDELGR